MDPVIIVSDNWVKKDRYMFNPDKGGCRVLQVQEQTSYDNLEQMIMEDYGLESRRCKIQLSYMFSYKILKKLSQDTPPVYVCNTRQLQSFLSLIKIDQLRLCMEVTKINDDDVMQKGKSKRTFSHVSKDEGNEAFNSCDLDDDIHYRAESPAEFSEYKDMESKAVSYEGGDESEDEEDDEFDTRFDIIDDPDSASSDDDNFCLLGKPVEEDENSPNLPPKKRLHNISKPDLKGSDEFLKLEMSSLNISVGQRYARKKNLELRLKLLTVRDRFDFDVPVSTKEMLIVKCWVNGCSWRVRASTQGKSPEFYIRVYDKEHTCSVTERSNRFRQATPDILGALYRDFLGDIDPSVKPRHVAVAITKQFGIKMDYWKAHRTSRFARRIDTKSLEQGYEDLPSYLYMIRRANPGTITRLQLDVEGRFKYLFIAFGASVNGLSFVRKVVVVDGAFLHGKYKGTLLTALAQDGNFQIFPIAFGVVDTENDDSWQWFFSQLKLVVPDEKGLAIISDRHNSIGKAIGTVYPLAARGICTYHLYKNILVRFKSENLFRLVKKAANYYRMDEFNAIFDEIRTLNPDLHGYLQRVDVRMWTRVHFLGDKYNITTTNIADSMNKVLSKARSLPIVRLLETIRSMMTRWFAERREDARSMKTTLTRGVEKLLEDRVSGARLAQVQNIDHVHTEVTCGTSLHVVNLNARRCTCRRFNIEEVSCVHEIASAEHRNVSRISLCDPYCRRDYLANAYAGTVMSMDTALSVPERVAKQVSLPPIPRQQPGRPKMSRFQSSLEVALAKKRPRKQHMCSLCNRVGHNAKTCKP